MSHTEKWIEQLRVAIDYANSDDITEQHRKTIKRALDMALRDALEDYERLQSQENDGKPWKPQEIQLLSDYLDSIEPARTFQEEDDKCGTISARLKRSAKGVKRKAVELGKGEKLDYWLATSRDR